MEIVADYQAVHDAAILGETAARAQVAVSGRDRAAYLQGLLTNDIEALTPGSGCYAAWLTPQGRMLTDMHVLESGDMILLDLPASQVDQTLQRLDQFLFSEDVQFSDLRGSLARMSVHGPSAAAVVGSVVTGLPPLAAFDRYQNVRGTLDGSPVVVARIDQLGVPGLVVFVEPDRAAALSARFQAAGAIKASKATLEAARIEAGTPLFGVDMDDDTIPLEAGIEQQAISFTKGCYVGQEVIVRVLHRGHGRVAKKLVSLRIGDGAAPAIGRRIYSADREIGRITSSAMSPRFGPIALGYVHRDFIDPGTQVAVERDGGRVDATVDARPMRAGHEERGHEGYQGHQE